MPEAREVPSAWVIVSAGFHFGGGQAKAVAGLASYLARAGHPVHLVGHDFDPRLAKAINVTVHPVRRPLRADLLGNVLLARTGRAVARVVSAADPTARVVVNGGNCVWADINWVHYLHGAFTPHLSAAPAWFRLKEWTAGSWFRRRERVALRTARVVVTNSKRTTADVVTRLGLAEDRVRTVYYGADATWAPPSAEERRASRLRFELPPDRPVVVFVGGFGHDNRKGFDTLLNAWKRVTLDPAWDAELVMAGDGRAMPAVAAQVEQTGLAGRVRLLGFTDRVFELLAAADLLVSPVRYEPYGLNVQEAICRGVPAVVSAVAGVAEEYPADLAGAVLQNSEDSEALAGILRHWREDIPGWRARFLPLSERLRSRSWDDMARQFVCAVSG